MAKMKSGDFETDREHDELREIEVTLDFTPNALASILYRQGNTVILACVTKADGLPRWFPRDSSRGWVHAEYSLLPGSTDSRFRRERGGAKGRTQEIERLDFAIQIAKNASYKNLNFLEISFPRRGKIFLK